jgi:hypothetical protein
LMVLGERYMEARSYRHNINISHQHIGRMRGRVIPTMGRGGHVPRVPTREDGWWWANQGLPGNPSFESIRARDCADLPAAPHRPLAPLVKVPAACGRGSLAPGRRDLSPVSVHTYKYAYPASKIMGCASTYSPHVPPRGRNVLSLAVLGSLFLLVVLIVSSLSGALVPPSRDPVTPPVNVLSVDHLVPQASSSDHPAELAKEKGPVSGLSLTVHLISRGSSRTLAPAVITGTSTNWAGYAYCPAFNGTGCPTPAATNKVVGVQGSWVVPTIASPGSPGARE